jgi:hypothetical protein
VASLELRLVEPEAFEGAVAFTMVPGVAEQYTA